MAQSYVSNRNESVRMFKSDLMEFFSHVHPVTPLVLYLPVIGYMLYLAFLENKLSILAVAGLFLFGVLIWTLLEYIIHRTCFIMNLRAILENDCTLSCTAFITIIPTM